jgi:beta-N-acetylhexosaminidase
MATPAARATIRRRRAAALLVAIAATAAIWALLLREGAGSSGGSAADRPSGVSEPVAGLVRSMSPAERVDQVLLLGFEGTGSDSPVMTELRARQLGGVVVGSGNWVDRAQGAALIAHLRAAGLAGNRIPPLIVTQQEGGRYRSLPDLPPAETELRIGSRGSPPLVERWASDTAAALRSVGVDLNLSPVADVASADSPLAGRAFSDDPAVAAELTAAAARGCSEGGTNCAVLHFPGLGAASQDTDAGPATVSLDSASLADRDLPAFRAAFAEHVPAVVLSLAFYAAYDPVTPGALARPVATGLLRDQLHFQGAAITDDLGAGAIKAIEGVPQAAVAAVQAGADMVQVDSPADQNGVREALIHAASDGEIPEARLAEAAGRVLELKRQVGLLQRALPHTPSG